MSFSCWFVISRKEWLKLKKEAARQTPRRLVYLRSHFVVKGLLLLHAHHWEGLVLISRSQCNLELSQRTWNSWAIVLDSLLANCNRCSCCLLGRISACASSRNSCSSTSIASSSILTWRLSQSSTLWRLTNQDRRRDRREADRNKQPPLESPLTREAGWITETNKERIQ